MPGGSEKVVAVPKAKPVATPTPPTPQKVVVELVLKNSEPAAPTPVSTPRVEQPIVRSAAPAPAPAPQQGKVIACFRTNGSGDQHFPIMRWIAGQASPMRLTTDRKATTMSLARLNPCPAVSQG